MRNRSHERDESENGRVEEAALRRAEEAAEQESGPGLARYERGWEKHKGGEKKKSDLDLESLIILLVPLGNFLKTDKKTQHADMYKQKTAVKKYLDIPQAK